MQHQIEVQETVLSGPENMLEDRSKRLYSIFIFGRSLTHFLDLLLGVSWINMEVGVLEINQSVEYNISDAFWAKRLYV